MFEIVGNSVVRCGHRNNQTGVTDMANDYNDLFEAYIGTGRNDNKGREVGWVVGLNNNGTTFAAWVQNARKVNGEWKEFGVQQRSRSFPSQAIATAWAYATAQVRRHKFLTA
jgi:hypothetical protein